MANGKVKKYFKNLKEMMREGVNVPKPKKKAVDGKTNYGINWNKKTKVPKTRPADEIRTGGAQGGIGLTTLPTGTEQTTKTKQGKKPKKKDYLTGIKQPPLESKRAGEVNLDNVKKVKHPFLRLTAKETSDKSFKTEGDTTKHPMLPGAKKTEYVLQKNGKNKTKTLAPIGGVAGVEMGTEAAQEAGIATTEGKSKIKTPGQKAKKKKKKKKLTEAVNVLSGNQVSQGVIGGTGESIGTKYSNRLFGGTTEKKSKKNKKKRGR
jgi:hypothetical protein